MGCLTIPSDDDESLGEGKEEDRIHMMIMIMVWW